MNIQLFDTNLAQDLRLKLERAAAVNWMERYGERFPAQWEVTSVNMVGDMVDITFTWVE